MRIARAVALVTAMMLFIVPMATRAQTPRFVATYSAGWNLVGGTPGTILTGASIPLYTYQAGDSDYEPVSATVFGVHPNGEAATLGSEFGYWAFFAQPTAVMIALAGPHPIPGGRTQGALYFTINAPPQQWFMIGNPYSGAVTVTGADVMYTYDSGRGYQATSILQSGQGAFAYSSVGGAIRICPANLVFQ